MKPERPTRREGGGRRENPKSEQEDSQTETQEQSSEQPEEAKQERPALDLENLDTNEVRAEAGQYLDRLAGELGVDLNDKEKQSAVLELSGVLRTAAEQVQQDIEGGTIAPEERVRKKALEQIRRFSNDAELSRKIGEMLGDETEEGKESLPEVGLEEDPEDEHQDKRIALEFLRGAQKQLSDEQKTALARMKAQAESPQDWMRDMATDFSTQYEFRNALKRAREFNQDEDKVKADLAEAATSYLRNQSREQKQAA